MVRYELGKWNLDELAKNPNRKIIDKNLDDVKNITKLHNLDIYTFNDTKDYFDVRYIK